MSKSKTNKFEEPTVFVEKNCITLFQNDKQQIHIKLKDIPELFKNILEAMRFMNNQKLIDVRRKYKPKLGLVKK